MATKRSANKPGKGESSRKKNKIPEFSTTEMLKTNIKIGDRTAYEMIYC